MIWPTTGSLAVFLGIVGLVLAAMVLAVAASAPPEHRVRDGAIASAVALLWLGITGALPFSGIVAPGSFGPAIAYAFGSLGLAVALGLSPVGRRVAEHVPVAFLVGFHAFRLPLELVLHDWAAQGTIPDDLSWSGQNFDIVTALLALVVAPMAARWPHAVTAFQVVGVGMLLNIVRIVARNTEGSPLYAPHGEPPLELAFYVPTTWIVSVCVAGAFAGHAVLAVWSMRRR